MNDQRQKCSLSKHSNVEAISYCQECKTFMCNECQNHHFELFDKHSINTLNKDFNIELKNPIFQLHYHTNNVLCLTILKDERLVSGARDYSIIVYNKTTYLLEIKIKKHNGAILCLCPLSSGALASCSEDNTIMFFSIKGINYEVLQILNYHKDSVYKIIEIKN